MEFAIQHFRKTDKKVAVLGGSGSYAIKNAIWLVLLFNRWFESTISFMRPKTMPFGRYWTFWKRTLYKKIILLIIFGKKSLILQSFYQKKIQIQLST
jgi:hypothetical protein